MSYVALYRTWRPQDFDGLVGQDHIRTALTNALEMGKIAHAYLFTGPRGTGKTSTARILAKALNCEKGPTAHPCNECNNCKQITAGSSMDVIEIDAASNRGIDEIRQLRERVSFAPVNCRYKVYIIDEVHMITTDAFNALLKTLEEPPEHVVFILATTEPQKIPATIHSRCQRYDFHRVGVEDIAKHLAKVAKGSGIDADADALHLMAIQADGGMRDAVSLLDQCAVMDKKVTALTVRQVLGIVGRESLRKLVTLLGRQDLTGSLGVLNQLTMDGKDIKQILVELTEYFRALLLFKAKAGYEDIYLTDTAEAFAAIADLYTNERILAATSRIHKALEEIRFSARERIVAELCLFDLCRIQGDTVVALAARVAQLEKRLAEGSVTVAAHPANLVSHEFQPSPAKAGQEADLSTISNDKGKNVPKFMPTVETHEVPATNTTAATIDGPSGTSADGVELWSGLCQALKSRRKRTILAYAEMGTVLGLTSEKLVVGFSTETSRDRMEEADYKDVLLNIIKELTGKPLALEFVEKAGLEPTQIKVMPKKATTDAPVQKPPAVKELPKDVKQALNVFGGSLDKV